MGKKIIWKATRTGDQKNKGQLSLCVGEKTLLGQVNEEVSWILG